MNGKKNRPGGQGSSGGSGSGGGGSGDGTVINEETFDPYAFDFDFPGRGSDGEWSDKDTENVQEVMYGENVDGQLVGGINDLIAMGQIKVDKEAGVDTMDEAIKRYLNDLMEDEGITLAQYQALKIYYGIE